MLSKIQFGAINLRELPQGQAHKVKNNQTGQEFTFSNWQVNTKGQPMKALLTDAEGRKVAEVEVRKEGGCCEEKLCCGAQLIADTLDLSTQKGE